MTRVTTFLHFLFTHVRMCVRVRVRIKEYKNSKKSVTIRLNPLIHKALRVTKTILNLSRLCHAFPETLDT